MLPPSQLSVIARRPAPPEPVGYPDPDDVLFDRISEPASDLYAEVTVLHQNSCSKQFFGDLFTTLEDLQDWPFCPHTKSRLKKAERLLKELHADKTENQRFGKAFTLVEELRKLRKSL